MTVTGERVTTPEGGFNPTWQRHVAAYAAAAAALPPESPVLDLGCGVGHSFSLLAPRETVGVDLDAEVLAGQERRTVVADMRSLPFGDDEFASVLSVQSIEHVPDPERVFAEVVRVLRPGGTALFVTPNRLTFARADEIIDPYHYREYSPDELRSVCSNVFASVSISGLFGSPRYQVLVEEQKAALDRLLRKDPLRVRRAVPMKVRQRLYDRMLTRARRVEDSRAAEITPSDFWVASEGLDDCLDVIAVCQRA